VAGIGKTSMAAGREAVLATVRQTIQQLGKAPSFNALLDHDGIPIAVVGQALRLLVVDLDYPSLGFLKLTGLLRHACTGTKLQIARRSSETVIYLVRRCRVKAADGWEAYPDLSDSEMQRESYYRAILAQGTPIIRFADPASLRFIIGQLSAAPPSGDLLAAAIETSAEALQGRVPAEQIRQGILSLVNVGAFTREPADIPLAEQRLTLRDDWRDPDQAITRIQAAAREKISRFLDKVDETVLSRIL
jgi:hypothetical protein